MKFFSIKSSQNQLQSDRLKLYKDFYEFNKTFLNGFPANPTCLAFDEQNRLLAIGTKNGSLQIYGKPGVEFHYQFEEEYEIEKIFFISHLAAILCMLDDYSLHLFKIPTKSSHQNNMTKLYTNNFFVNKNNDSNDQQSSSFMITTLSLNSKKNLLFIGLKNGDIYTLNIDETFSIKSDNIIKLDDVLKSIPEELKLKPGSIEAIEEQPDNDGNILIGYDRSLIALWNYHNKNIVNYFQIEQHLEHLSWNKNGVDFISCHNDGSYNKWSSKQEHHDCKNSELPYGPFPCKAIKKIFWNTFDKNDFIIFNGGMPRASYSDKETVSIIFNGDISKEKSPSSDEKNVVLDFTSKVIDFLPIFINAEMGDDKKLEALIVLTIEEIVVIDLQHPDWPQYKLPYLACLHSSPITCSQYCSSVSAEIYQKIIECGDSESSVKYSTNEWPINGGTAASSSLNNDENLQQHHLLITGHEDGTVRFWDTSTKSLKYLHTVHTSKLFNTNEDDLLIDHDDHERSNNDEDDDDQSDWPPFRRVGQFDPYSDDPRLAIRKLAFCSEQGILVIGGTAGQMIVYEYQDNNNEFSINSIEVRIIDEKDSFVWKGHNCIPVRRSNLKFVKGFQPKSFVQIHPPAALTALVLSSSWQVVSAGTAHGFTLFDYTKNLRLIVKSTLKASNISSAMGGDALISRRKSFKKSLRESFRRLRRSRSQKSKRNVQKNSQSTTKLSETNQRFLNKFPEHLNESIKPVERAIEAMSKSNDDMMSSMVRFFYFCSSPIVSNQPCPSFWIGTNAGTLYIYVLINDKNQSQGATKCWQLAKEVQLKHKAPIIFIRLIDSNGIPSFENLSLPSAQTASESPEKSIMNRVLICSEEQFKTFSLPNFKTINKFKLTAHEGVRVRKIEIGKFHHKQNSNLFEYSLMVLTNLGDINIFSLWPDFKRKYQHHFIKKEDIHGISSLVLTNTGEGFYLKSSSEYQRFSLSARRSDFLDCHLKFIENETTVRTENKPTTNINKSKNTDNDDNKQSSPITSQKIVKNIDMNKNQNGLEMANGNVVAPIVGEVVAGGATTTTTTTAASVAGSEQTDS